MGKTVDIKVHNKDYATIQLRFYNKEREVLFYNIDYATRLQQQELHNKKLFDPFK